MKTIDKLGFQLAANEYGRVFDVLNFRCNIIKVIFI